MQKKPLHTLLHFTIGKRLCGFLLFIIPVFFLPSCLKYPDGPIVSLRTPEERISNFWVIEKYIENGQDLTEPYISVHEDFILRMGKDNSFDHYGKLMGAAWSRSGEWHFKNSKKDFRMMNQNSDSAYEFHILKLNKHHFWISQQDALTQNTYEWHYKPRKL